jgi:hypothetical protein
MRTGRRCSSRGAGLRLRLCFSTIGLLALSKDAARLLPDAQRLRSKLSVGTTTSRTPTAQKICVKLTL